MTERSHQQRVEEVGEDDDDDLRPPHRCEPVDPLMQAVPQRDRPAEVIEHEKRAADRVEDREAGVLQSKL